MNEYKHGNDFRSFFGKAISKVVLTKSREFEPIGMVTEKVKKYMNCGLMIKISVCYAEAFNFWLRKN